ncbi:beta-lactamase [Methanococcoides methylutens]|uniref:Beta-lactamase n=1 Tax=Methanococcoides methylutens TaxID=2226 RepID=A0A099T1Z8_METMT|nr:MBL fold hydrolase [Methanococcoides methylutens]KGK99185.1 beta-lactamase [Methanococcoides methylutens]
MIVQQIFTSGIAHSSYLLGGNNTCAVIDPGRDIDVYMDAAAQMGWKITHVLETHLHADFISGHMEIQNKTGASIVFPRSANCKFDAMEVSEGDSFEIEDMIIEVLETPGHTPEHVSYVVTDSSRGEVPVCVFCGDTLFVGDIGRPDLFPGKAEELASKLYDTLHGKLLDLPDFCEVYPAHGAGSLCGRSMAAKRSTTIGYERLYNYALNIGDRKSFIRSLTEDMPATPAHFNRCSDVNRAGPELVEDLPPLKAIPSEEFLELLDDPDNIVLDIRCYEAFGGRHIPGAYSIDLNSNFATFSGWLLPPDKNILLIVDSPERATEAAIWLHRVGLDRIVGFLDGGMHSWSMAGLPTEHLCQVSSLELDNMVRDDEDFVLVDVRAVSEFSGGHIQHAINIPVHELRDSYKELDPDAKTVVICGSGQRSSMGASILQQKGFSDVHNVSGGMTGYNVAGFGPDCPLCALPWLSSGKEKKDG